MSEPKLQIITLEQIKENARIEGNSEDALLTRLGAAAEETVLNLIERTYADLIAEYTYIPANIQQACLMYTNHLYEHRGIVNPTALYNVPYSIDAMLRSYIRYDR